MAINFRNSAGRDWCTEYVVKAGESLASIAKDYLGDASQASIILMKWNPAAKKQDTLNGAHVNVGDILLLPPVQDSIKNKNTTVRDKLNQLDLRARAQNSSVTLEAYYIERKTILSFLSK